MPLQRKMVPLQFNGFETDKSPDVLPPEVLTLANNMYTREGMTRVAGKEPVFPPTIFDPLWAINTVERALNATAWLYTGNTGFAVVVNGVHSDITPVGGVAPTQTFNPFTGGELNGVPVWNQPNDPPYFWDGITANPAQELVGWPVGFRAGFIRPYKFHLVAAPIDDTTGVDPDLVFWSDRAIPGALPTEWTPTPSNEAGSVSIGATPGIIIDGRELRGSLYIYKSTSTYRLTYVGGAQVMRSELVFPESGAMSRNCIAAMNTFHCVLTDNDVVVHDGQNLRSIANDRIKRQIFATLDPDNFPNSFVIANSNEREFWICVPELGSTYPTIAYVWNASDDAWGVRELTEAPPHIAVGDVATAQPVDTTWDGQVGDWDSQVNDWNDSGIVVGRYSLLSCGFTQSQLYLLEQTPLDDGNAVPGTFQRVTLDLGEPERVKFLKAVWVSANGEVGTELRVRVAGQLQPQDPVVWGDYLPFTIGSGQRKVDTSAMGRYLSVEVSSIVESNQWRVPELTLEIERSGLY